MNNQEIIENLIKWITIFEDKKILREKIKKANARGGNDNISIAYLKKESGDV